MPTYEDLVEVSVQQMVDIVGTAMAVNAARSIDGLRVADDGTVTALDGSGKAALRELVDTYTAQAGEMPRKRIAQTVQARYDYIDVDLPENLASAMEAAPVDTVVDELDDGVLVLDEDDCVIDVNPAAEELLDRDAEAFLGAAVDEVLPDADRLLSEGDRARRPDALDDLDVDAEASDGGVPNLLSMDVDGDERHYDVRVSPLHDSQGLRAGSAIVLRDVTLREYHRRQLAERTEELERKNNELRQKNQRLEQFTEFVSHDLRNPLNVAQGHVELVEHTGDAEGAIEEIGPALDRMEELIEDLLAMAREGQEITEFRPVDLAAVARAAWSTVDTKAATLEVTTERAVSGDEQRVRQIFENLFRNAVEHGGDEVTVRVGDLDDGFYVEDDGPGIPESDREDVLDLGYTMSDEGTGFGLGIVDQIAVGHGWETAVTEGREGGARFEFIGVEFVD